VVIALTRCALARVAITFVPVKFTLRVEIILFRVEITFCVMKLHLAFRNYSRACEHHTMRVIKTLHHRKQHIKVWFGHS
jgi:hypothetical protein